MLRLVILVCSGVAGILAGIKISDNWSSKGRQRGVVILASATGLVSGVFLCWGIAAKRSGLNLTAHAIAFVTSIVYGLTEHGGLGSVVVAVYYLVAASRNATAYDVVGFLSWSCAVGAAVVLGRRRRRSPPEEERNGPEQEEDVCLGAWCKPDDLDEFVRGVERQGRELRTLPQHAAAEV